MSNFTQQEEVWIRAYTATLTGYLARGYIGGTVREEAFHTAKLAVIDFNDYFYPSKEDLPITDEK